jgi:transcriptional regulator with XRE-family HTH domain
MPVLKNACPVGEGTTKKELLDRITQLEAENLELLSRAGELPDMPRNSEGVPFSGPRLIMARHRRGLSLDECAEQLHVDRRTLIGFESETVAPILDQIVNMSMLLGFPIKFFYAEGVRLIDPEKISWRDGPWQWDADHLHERKWVGS